MARKREPARLHGLIVIDKPAGFTSHDVVAKLRRITGERKAGHAGTLDPMATGVLPVAFGDATRVLEYLAGASKVYRAEITFGIATDTLDAEGRVTAIDPTPGVERAELEAAVASFLGKFDQLPPMHSAIKIGGVKLYELARRGEEIDRPARPVEVHGIDLIDWEAPVATVDVHSSKGFYVRSLARDLGERLGTVAHLSNLVRLATGPFSLEDAWTFGELEAFTRDEISGFWTDIALHPDTLLQELPAIVIGDADRLRWRQGMGLSLEPVTDETVNVYAAGGEWLGIGRGAIERNEWQPVKVMGGGGQPPREPDDASTAAMNEGPVTDVQAETIENPRTPTVITLGTFDGVHLGHQHLIRTTMEHARAIGAQSAVLTFEPIPMMVLRPDKFMGRICTADEKMRLLTQTGVDVVDILSFDREFSLQTPEEFLATVMARYDLKEIVVGEDFSLGKDRAGNVEKLTELGRAFGFTVTGLTRIGDTDESFSSTDVREAILAGNVTRAAELLGRYYHVEGVVVHGSHFGRQIGYPTANIDPPADHVPLADGIYASRCWLPDEDAPRDAMSYVGTRPTVNSGPRSIETNIFDYSGDLYGRRLKVELVQRMRPDENFPTLEEMVAQMGRDEEATRLVLGNLR